MTFEEVPTQDAAGLVLAAPILRPCGRKILAKGRRLAADDVRMLAREGTSGVWVVRLEPDEVDECEAAGRVATALAAGLVAIESSADGRATVAAADAVTIEVDRERLNRLNAVGGLTVATLPQWSSVAAGNAVAVVKCRPFGVKRLLLDAWLDGLSREGPILRAHPAGRAQMTAIYCDPVNPRRAQELLSPGVRLRADRLGLYLTSLVAHEEVGELTSCLRRALETRPPVILIASTISPSAPEDAIGQAMLQAGGQIETYLAPVEPGMLLLLAYAGNTAILSAPGCVRSKAPDVLSLILPPLLAGLRLAAADIAALGVGGLLSLSTPRQLRAQLPGS